MITITIGTSTLNLFSEDNAAISAMTKDDSRAKAIGRLREKAKRVQRFWITHFEGRDDPRTVVINDSYRR